MMALGRGIGGVRSADPQDLLPDLRLPHGVTQSFPRCHGSAADDVVDRRQGEFRMVQVPVPHLSPVFAFRDQMTVVIGSAPPFHCPGARPSTKFSEGHCRWVFSVDRFYEIKLKQPLA
jgi:hypothetical protein